MDWPRNVHKSQQDYEENLAMCPVEMQDLCMGPVILAQLLGFLDFNT